MKFGIRKKLLSGFMIVLMLFSGTVIFALYSIHSLLGNVQKTHDHPLAVTRAAIKIEVMVTSMHRSMKDVSISNDKEERERYIALVSEEEKEALRQFDIVQKQILGDEGQTLALNVRQILVKWQPIRQRVIALTEVGRHNQAQHITRTEGHDYVEFLMIELEKLGDYAARKAMEFNEGSTDIAIRAQTITIAALILSITLSVLLSLRLSFSITGRLYAVSSAAEKMAGGDLKQVIETKGKDELNDVAKSFNSMADKLSIAYETLEEKVRERTKDLKESEEKFAGFIDSATDGFTLLDSELNYIEINKSALEIVGLDRKYFIGKNIIDVVPDIKKTGRYDKYKKVIKTSVPFLVSDLIPHPKFGNKHIELKAFKVSDGLGIIFTDITEQVRAEEQIKASLREKEVLLREIHHRVKNNMQVIISLLRLQSDYTKGKQYKEMLEDSQSRIKSMSLIHEKLYQSEDLANIDFNGYVKDLGNRLFGSYGVSPEKIALNIEIEDVSLGLENAIPCGLIINELVSNSLKHAFPQEREGEIRITLRSINGDEIELTVSDNGVGIPEDLDFRNTESLGLHLVTILSEDQLDGKIELNRTGGTKFHIQFKRETYRGRV